MVVRCLATDGLGYQVFNVSNDDTSVGLPSRGGRSTASTRASRRPAPSRATQTFYANAKATRMVGFAPSPRLARPAVIAAPGTSRAFEAAAGEARAARAAGLDRICRDHGLPGPRRATACPRPRVDGVWEAAAGLLRPGPRGQGRGRGAGPATPTAGSAPTARRWPGPRARRRLPTSRNRFNGGPPDRPEGIADPDAYAFCYAPTPWPDLPGFRDAWLAYYAAMDDLAARVMRAMAAALGLPEDRFEPVLRHPISALRALHYPPTPAAALPGQQRAGAHTDYGSLTILRPQPGSRGLEIRDPATGAWAEVAAPPGAFVVNIGDLMALWTSDRLGLHAPPRRGDPRPARPPEPRLLPPARLGGRDRPPRRLGRPRPVRSGPYLMGQVPRRRRLDAARGHGAPQARRCGSSPLDAAPRPGLGPRMTAATPLAAGPTGWAAHARAPPGPRRAARAVERGGLRHPHDRRGPARLVRSSRRSPA